MLLQEKLQIILNGGCLFITAVGAISQDWWVLMVNTFSLEESSSYNYWTNNRADMTLSDHKDYKDESKIQLIQLY